MERVDHLHLQAIVVHGHAPVFRLHHIDAHDEWINGSQFEGADQLHEDRLRRQSAQHLIEKANLEIAGRRCSIRPAMLPLTPAALTFIELCPLIGQVFRQPGIEQLLPQAGKVGLHLDGPKVPGQGGYGRPDLGRIHNFKVLLVLRGRPAGQLLDPFTQVPGIFDGQEMIKGRKKVVVSRLPGDGNTSPFCAIGCG
jgi:hypothetical protein